MAGVSAMLATCDISSAVLMCRSVAMSLKRTVFSSCLSMGGFWLKNLRDIGFLSRWFMGMLGLFKM